MELLRVEGVCKDFFGNRAVDSVSFSVNKGEIVGIIGANGSGKTTLFNCLSGYCRCDKGRVFLNGVDITGMSGDRRCRLGLARTYQIPKPFPTLTVLENVMVGGLLKHKDKQTARELAIEKLRLTRLSGKENILASHITPGDCRRLALAAALATEPVLLLLDEVMAGLNPWEFDTMAELIMKLGKKEGLGIVMIEHNMSVLMKLSDRVIAMDKGCIIASGSPGCVAAHPLLQGIYFGGNNA